MQNPSPKQVHFVKHKYTPGSNISFLKCQEFLRLVFYLPQSGCPKQLNMVMSNHYTSWAVPMPLRQNVGS